jgi:hypothetical protein
LVACFDFGCFWFCCLPWVHPHLSIFTYIQEAYLQRSLDETDPTIPGPSPAQQTILAAVPADATPLVFGSIGSTGSGGDGVSNSVGAGSGGGGGGGGKSSSWRKIRQHVQPKTSTAEQLFALALDFDQHLDKNANNNIQNSNTTIMASTPILDNKSGGRKTSADIMANAGATLLRRHRGGGTGGGGTSTDIGLNPITERTTSTRVMMGESGGGRPSVHEIEASNRTRTSQTSGGEVVKSPSKDNNNNDDNGEDCDDDDNDNGKRRQENLQVKWKRANYTVKSSYKDFESWLKYDKIGYRVYFKWVAILIALLVGTAAILYYAVKNPPIGYLEEDCAELKKILKNATNTAANNSEQEQVKITSDVLRKTFETASYSWWLLFLARQLVTFSMAKVGQAILIEYLALRTRICVALFGPFVTLFIVQSKGWPMHAFLWAMSDWFLLYGNSAFVEHWYVCDERDRDRKAGNQDNDKMQGCLFIWFLETPPIG